MPARTRRKADTSSPHLHGYIAHIQYAGSAQEASSNPTSSRKCTKARRLIVRPQAARPDLGTAEANMLHHDESQGWFSSTTHAHCSELTQQHRYRCCKLQPCPDSRIITDESHNRDRETRMVSSSPLPRQRRLGRVLRHKAGGTTDAGELDNLANQDHDDTVITKREEMTNNL